jgi:hypothetical protein
MTNLIVVEKTNWKTNDGRFMYTCLCVCGQYTLVPGNAINRVKSCGCMNSAYITNAKKTHGLTKHPLYPRWNAIHKRCYLKTDSRYKFYGAKGVKMCVEWRDSPEAFITWFCNLTDDFSLTVDRIDTYGDYSPGNCRLITLEEQQKNRRPRSCYKLKTEE